MKLSICTMFYDKNIDLYSEWVKKTNEVVKVEHELIAVDNTTDQKMTEVKGSKLVKAGGSMLPFEARRIGTENATGDYVYLVDPDDEVMEIKEFDYSDDLVCFNYFATSETDDKMYLCSQPYSVSYAASKTQFFNDCWRKAVKNMTWNKFIKREVLLRVYAKLPRPLVFAFMEDTLLSLLILTEVKSIYFDERAFYKYYFGSGMTTKDVYDDISPLRRCASGIEIALGVFEKSIPHELQKASGINTMGLYRGTAIYFVQKILQITERCEEEYAELLKNYFEKDLLLSVTKELFETNKINHTEKRQIKSFINDFID